MNKRLRELRKVLGLSQQEFGDKLLISKDHVSSLETGRRNITDRIIRDICSKYNVNKDWLLTGSGEQFLDITKNIDAPDHIKDMLKKFLLLNESDQKKLEFILDSFISEEEQKKEEN